jgi:hypothetical protein
MAKINYISSHYASTRNLQFSLIAVVPLWLQYMSELLIASSKGYASRFGSSSRHFYFTQSGTPNEFSSKIFCTGPNVEQTAWDLAFKVPVGGFRYGDIDPLTGEAFPGGERITEKGKRVTYVTLVDKFEAEGEEPKSVSRTYSKQSGQTVTKPGFFDQAIRHDIGTGIILSPVGMRSLKTLALLVGKEMAHAIGNQIKFECARKGLSCYVQGPDVITTEWK